MIDSRQHSRSKTLTLIHLETEDRIGTLEVLSASTSGAYIFIHITLQWNPLPQLDCWSCNIKQFTRFKILLFGIKWNPTYFSSDLYSVIAVWTFKCKKLIFCQVEGSFQIHEMHHQFFKIFKYFALLFYPWSRQHGEEKWQFFQFLYSSNPFQWFLFIW